MHLMYNTVFLHQHAKLTLPHDYHIYPVPVVKHEIFEFILFYSIWTKSAGRIARGNNCRPTPSFDGFKLTPSQFFARLFLSNISHNSHKYQTIYMRDLISQNIDYGYSNMHSIPAAYR